jgi:hypothetical protein
MENVMRLPVSYAALGSALGLALAATATTAQAQTIITPAVVDQPVVTIPAATVVQPETVQTTTTVRTVRPAPRLARRQIVTTRTITRRFVPTTTAIARTVPATPQPLYDEAAPAPVAMTPQPLYDEVAAPVADAAMVAPPVVGSGPAVASEPYTYRYVYQPDRILVVDPITGIAVRAIPR